MDSQLEQAAHDLAKQLGRARSRDQRMAGIILRQPTTLDPLDAPEPRWLNPALWVLLALLVIVGFVVWGHPALGGEPVPGHSPQAAQGPAAVPSDAELASLEQRARDIECMRCWLDGFSRDIRTMPKESRR